MLTSVLLGIDAGYSTTAPSTGICILRPGVIRPVTAARVWADATLGTIRTLLDIDRPTHIAIDAPLVPINSQRGFGIVKRYRECERHLSGGIFQKRCKPGATNSPRGHALHRQATRIANSLARQFVSCPIVEAFPNAYLGVMLPNTVFSRPIRRGIKSDVFWEHCFSRRGVMRELIKLLFGEHADKIFQEGEKIKNHDERAAFVCALTARGSELGASFRCIGQDGTIMLPPQQFIRRWARQHFVLKGVWPIGSNPVNQQAGPFDLRRDGSSGRL